MALVLIHDGIAASLAVFFDDAPMLIQGSPYPLLQSVEGYALCGLAGGALRLLRGLGITLYRYGLLGPLWGL